MVQPEVSRLIAEALYRMLVHEVVAAEFPRELGEYPDAHDPVLYRRVSTTARSSPKGHLRCD